MKKAFTWIADNINTQAFTNLYDSILFVIDFIVSRTSDSLAGILIKALPLLAPVPNAVSVWRISQQAPLHYDTLQAGALAASVEGLFFALTAVALDMFDGYLLDKNRYLWPLRIAAGLLIGFFVLVEIIVLCIETNPVAMAFPVISLIAAIGLAGRTLIAFNADATSFASEDVARAKDYSETLQAAAVKLLQDKQVDITDKVDTRIHGKDLMRLTGCSYNIARQHIAKAARRLRGQLVQRQWGGNREGAGRPTKDE